MPDDGRPGSHARHPGGAGASQAPPIIALTADASIEDRDRCAAAGMHDYLTKPLQIAELTRVLERWLSPAQARALRSPAIRRQPLPASR
jgi:two-component system sensor histidine kinase/response regulator